MSITETTSATTPVIASEPNHEGYREYELGHFRFRRDEYFAYITWPTGDHTLSLIHI